MISKKCNILLQYSDEDKQEIWRDCGLKESILEDDIEAIMEWFEKQPHLVNAGIDRDIIERLLFISKGSREKTKRKIDSLYRYRALTPDVIQNRDFFLNSNKKIWTWYRQGALPKLYNGKRISVIQFTDPDPNRFCYETLLKLTMMLCDFRLKHDYMKSDIWLLDLKNTGIGHLPRLSPMLLQRGIQLFQEGIGLRIDGIHVINAPSVAHRALVLAKQFLLPKILERVIFHDKLEDIYKYIPIKYLPSDYGGELESMEELTDKWQTELRSENTRKYLLDASKRISNESLRPGQRIEQDPLAGSFKVLNLD